MPPLINSLPTRHKILVVDDEPDVFALTKLSLKGLEYKGRKVELLDAATGRDAVNAMQRNPEIALILLDVVMKTNSAGLDACRRIREELGNSFVRIILRTGQPGEAPERQTIEQFDIDGYLPKAELTSDRLYSAGLWCKLSGSMQRNAREHYAVHAARTAFQISGALLSLMQSFPSLN